MTSVIFPIHNWVDQNCFLTVGKEMLGGKVPYRDIFEQKGPLLYAIHAVAVFISPKTFTGVYIIQIVFFTAYLWIIKKIAALFTSERLSVYASVITGIVTAVTYCYSRGDNAEEFCLPFIAYALYTMMKAFREDFGEAFSYKAMLVNGFFAGCIFWIKYSVLGFYIGFITGFFIISLIQREYLKAVVKSALFVVGNLAASIPWIIYFGINKASPLLFKVYIYDNIFLYSARLSFYKKILDVWKKLGINCLENFIMAVLIFAGIFFFCKDSGYIQGVKYKIYLVFCFITSFYGIYIGGRAYRYYFLPMAAFIILGVTAVTNLLFEYRITNFIFSRKFIAVVGAAGVVTVVLGSNCIYYYGKPKNYFPQYKFAEIMDREPSPTLLNYGFLDGGFYHAANIEPEEYYFCRSNIAREELPNLYESQLDSVRHRKAEFVVTRKRCKQNDNGLLDGEDDLYRNYDIISQEYEKHDRYMYTLLKRR